MGGVNRSDTDGAIVTWDFLGDMTFSKRMGFMEQGKDVGDMIKTAETIMRYFSVVRVYPSLYPLRFPLSYNYSSIMQQTNIC